MSFFPQFQNPVLMVYSRDEPMLYTNIYSFMNMEISTFKKGESK